MSIQKQDDECPGCQPALLDVQTGRPMAADTPHMKAVMKVWAGTFKQEREAFHRVTCQNSRSQSDLRLFHGITSRIQDAISSLPPA